MAEIFDLYIGTYTQALPHVDGKADGIYIYQFDSSSGELTRKGQFSEVINPAYLCIDAAGQHLYAVNESDADHEPVVYAFVIDPDSGDLTLLNQQPISGSAPCHLAIDNTGQVLVVANYSSGSVNAFRLNHDGSLGAATDIVQHHGRSVNRARQEAAHAHAVVIDAHNRVYVPDLGIDKIMMYQLDAEHGTLRPNHPAFVSIEAGAGPRHFVFHPGGTLAFVLNELQSTITAFAVDANNGGLTHVQTISTLPDDFTGENTCAAIRISDDGRFVYASNRGHDSIAIFAFDQRTATLTRIGHESTQGHTPRDFNIDPTGRFLLAANQDSDTIVVFRINHETGLLHAVGHTYSVPTPVCLLFT